MALRESNCTMRSSPWMNSWYAAKVGGWPVALAHKLKRESNSVASAAITRCRKASTAVSGCEIGPATGSSARNTVPSFAAEIWTWNRMLSACR